MDFFDLVVRGHQIKRSQPFRHINGRRPRAFLENRPPTDSPENISSLGVLCASNPAFGGMGGEHRLMLPEKGRLPPVRICFQFDKSETASGFFGHITVGQGSKRAMAHYREHQIV
jgi:hypothetical protein